jgi:hypothetical protein
MSDDQAQLDPAVKAALVDWIKKRLGLLGALHFKHSVQGCSCEPCKTIREVLGDD